MSEHSGSASVPHASKARPPRWGLALLIASVLLMGVGIAFGVIASRSAGEPATTTSTARDLVTGLASGTPPPAPTEPRTTAPEFLGPLTFRVGFSFFVGFVVAFALRSFLKVAIVAAGFFALALFGLQYMGLIDVHWGEMSGRYQAAVGRVEEGARAGWQWASGVLPSAASATAGFVAGFRRR